MLSRLSKTLIVMLLCLAGAQASVSVVQTATINSSVAVTTQTITLTQALTAGNTVIVAMGDTSTLTFNGCSDAVNGTYTQVNFAAGTNIRTRILYKANIAGGATSVTCTYASAIKFSVVFAEVSGVDPTSPLDVNATATGAGTSMTCGSVAGIAPNDYSVASAVNSNFGTISTTASGYSVLTSAGGAGSLITGVVTGEFDGGTHTFAPTETNSVSGNWACVQAEFRVLAPKITTISPASGAVTASVVIAGSNFGATQGTSTVKFNATTATPTSWSDTSITVPVPSGATTGNVVVKVGSLVSAGVSFTVAPTAVITSLSASSAPVGNSITITGSGFGTSRTLYPGTTSTVTFNGVAATTYGAWSTGTSITVTVPTGATSGPVAVVVGNVSSNTVAFTVSPKINSLTPASGAVTSSIVIAGSNFGSTQGTSTVKFNGTTATPTSWSDTSITVPVPSGATTGTVVVTVGGIASTGVSFTVAPTAVITSLSASSAPVGNSITITGSGFGTSRTLYPGTTSTVTFNGVAATTYGAWTTGTSITVTVPTGATSGPVAVVVGNVPSNTLNLLVSPKITSLSATSGYVADAITITGTSFGATQGSSTVTVGGLPPDGIPATASSWSDTSIGITIPARLCAGTNNVVVTVPRDLESNGVTFTVKPKIVSMTPNPAAVTGSITVTGTSFCDTQRTSTIKFSNNVTTGVPTNWSDTSITVPVPSGATTGNVVATVTSQLSNNFAFTVVPTATISSLSRTSGPAGVAVTITGTNFGTTQGASSVAFNGIPAAVTSWGSTSIGVTVPDAVTTGLVKVTVGAVASNGINFTATPTIATVLSAVHCDVTCATSGSIGENVTIAGTTFGGTKGTSTVTFNGITAATSNWSTTSITATVPNGVTVGAASVVVTVAAQASNSVSFTIVPGITSVSPSTAAEGTLLTITGKTFGSPQGSSSISFNGTPGSPTAWGDTSITVPVPTNALTGNLTITVGSQTSFPYWFVVAPVITGIAPATANTGDTITISGRNLVSQNPSPGSAMVNLPGATLSVNQTPTTSISLAIPNGTLSGNVSVTVGGLTSNTKPLTILDYRVTGISPSSGLVGTYVTISGSGFGSLQGSSTVTLNGLSVAIYSWSDTNIVAIVPTGATSGPFSLTVNGQTGTTPVFTVTALPYPWLDQDIGVTGLAGSASYSGDVFTIKGAGNVSQTPDAMHFAYQSFSGDGTIIARVSSVQGTTTPQAGVMIRESLSTNAASAMVYFNSGYAYFPVRPSTGGATVLYNTAFTSPAAPYWVKLSRTGNLFNAYISPDGNNWTQVGTANTSITMSQNALIGLAVADASTTVLETATFTNVSVGSTANPAPVITSLSATTASIGSQVLINGAHFGNAQNGSQVTVNGTLMTVNGWSDTAVTFTIPAGATSGALVVSVTPTMNDSNPVYFSITSQPLPSTWLDADIGAVGVTGSATYSGGTFTVKGAGTLSNTDSLHYAYQTLSGDGSIIARVASLQGTTTPQAGVMIRESLANNAASAMVYYDGSGLAWFYVRSSTGGTFNRYNTSFSSPAAPYWVKLSRSGNLFNAYISLDGSNWTQVGQANTSITMGQNALIGLAVADASTTVLETATFDHVSISSTANPAPVITSLSATTASIGSQVQINGVHFGASQGASLVTLNGLAVAVGTWSDTTIIFTVPAGATSGALLISVAPSMNESNAVFLTITTQPLPSPWVDSDIGAVGVTGSATYSGGTFTVKGAGTLSNTDAFHYAYQTLSGDGSIIARVASLQGTTTPQAGVMVRESLANNAASAMVYYDGNGLAWFYVRSSTGGTFNLYNTGFSSPAAPYWVRLIRNGNLFNAYISSNGTSWTQVGSANVSITMSQNAFVGLASASKSMSTLETATFDNVGITFGTTPYVSSVSPLVGGVGASVTITGSNFGASQGTSALKFNGATATSITSWSDSQIVALVPSSAPSGSGPVTVTVNSIVSNGNVMFKLMKPVITSLGPPAAPIGASVTITGSGFGLTNSYGSNVTFNGVMAPITSWSDTSIVVVVPTNATSGSLVVTNSGYSSEGVQFSVSAASAVTNVSPTVGVVGTLVTISGSNFGAIQSNSSANFNGVPATSIISWSDTSIQALVPQASSTGPVSVMLGGIGGSGPSFTVLAYTTLTNSLGYASNYTSTTIGGQWYVIDAQGGGCSSCTVRGTIHNVYDGVGNLLSTTDEAGHVTSYTYDANNNMASKTVGPDANGQYAITSYTYNNFGEVLTATDPLGKVTTNVYDAKGNLQSTTTPSPNGSTPGSVTYFAYNTLGQLTQITDPLNHITTLTYTPQGWISTIKDSQNNLTTYQYDAHGNRTAVIDPINGSAHPTTSTYDAMDRLTRTTYPDGTHVDFAYDYRGRRTTVTDQNQKVTTYGYDDEDRLTSVTDAQTPNSGVTAYAYDTESQLQTIIDANNHTTTFHYDNFGRVTQADFPSSLSEHYTYDAVGLLSDKTDRKGQLIHYTYDGMNRLTSKSYPDSTSVAYTYDLASRLTQVTDPSGIYTFVFDYMGRLVGTSTQYSFLPGTPLAITYAYDAASNRIGMVDPQNAPTVYGYDTLNRLTSLLSPVSATPFGFSYDALGRRTQMSRPNGINTNYNYDGLSRLLSVLHQVGASSPLDGATYTYDNAGIRLTRQDNRTNVTTNYGYDNIYQLISATGGSSESYTFDPVGNRLTSAGIPNYTVNSSNQLTSTSNATYTYDNNGNTVTKVDASGTTNYTWDFENRLTQVTLPGSGGTVSFKYDSQGRRIQKTVSVGGGNTIYVLEGANALEELNSIGTVTARYTMGPGVDQPLAEVRGATTSFYEADGLGSITSLTTVSGAIANTYTYDSFGNQTASTGTVVNPFRYTAREIDQETGLMYYRARYYDPGVGRFMNEDPIKFAGGNDFYKYAGNNPIDATDPSGLCSKECGVIFPPQYTKSGRIKRGTQFDFYAFFLDDSTHDPKCCEVRQEISWNTSLGNNTNWGGPHDGFAPPENQPRHWYEDRDENNSRYGHRGKEGKNNHYQGDGYHGFDQPNSSRPIDGFEEYFRLSVVDVCNGNKVVSGPSPVLTVDFSK